MEDKIVSYNNKKMYFVSLREYNNLIPKMYCHSSQFQKNIPQTK